MKKFVLGIDVGGTSAKFGLVNIDGDVFHEGAVTTTGTTDVNQVLKPIHDVISEVLSANSDYQLMAAGIGAPMEIIIQALLSMRPIWVGVTMWISLLSSRSISTFQQC